MQRARYSALWLLSGAMALVLAVACGAALSGALTAASAVGGIREQTIAAIAVVSLLIGSTVALVAGLRDLASVARTGTASLPRRWIVGSILALPIAGPFWNLCVVQIQERISGSDSVRISFDNVLYALVLTLMLPLMVGVPLMLRRLRPQALVIGLAVFLQLSCVAGPATPPDVRAELAPTGTLRAAINFGNPILATRDAATGERRGLSVDLSPEPARRLDVPVGLVTYEAAGREMADATAGAWDVGFVAIDPARATDIAFTAAYVAPCGQTVSETRHIGHPPSVCRRARAKSPWCLHNRPCHSLIDHGRGGRSRSRGSNE